MVWIGMVATVSMLPLGSRRSGLTWNTSRKNSSLARLGGEGGGGGVALDLQEDAPPLPIERRPGKGAVEQQIGEHVQREVELLGRDRVVVDGALVAGVGVDVAAHVPDRARNLLEAGPPPRAQEVGVLEPVGAAP